MKHQNSPDSRGTQADEALDRRIAESLQDRYGPPSDETIMGAAGVAPPAPFGPAGTGPIAALAVAAGLVWAVFTFNGMAIAPGDGAIDAVSPTPSTEPLTEPPIEQTSAGEERLEGWLADYDQISSGDAVPMCSCDPVCGSFAEHCHNLFARGLDIAADAAVEVVGESCCDVEEGSVTLAARCGDETVCLIVLLREAAPILHEKIRRGLSIHRRDLGDLTAFEVSKLPEPTILPHLVVN